MKKLDLALSHPYDERETNFGSFPLIFQSISRCFQFFSSFGKAQPLKFQWPIFDKAPYHL